MSSCRELSSELSSGRKQEALALGRKEYTTSVGTQSPGGRND